MISTEVKTHAIVTFTKSHHLITQKQFDAITQMSAGEQFLVDGNLIKTNNIAEILEMSKYRDAYPDKTYNYGQPYTKVLEEHKDWLELPETIDDESRRLRVYKIMLAGFKRAQKRQDGPNVRQLIKQAEEKIKQAEYVPATTNT